MPALPRTPRHDAHNAADTVAHTLTVQAAGADQVQALTAAQRNFNRLLARVDKLSAQIDATRAAADAHRPVYATSMGELQQQHAALIRRLADWLDQRLLARGLTPAQRRQVTELIIQLCEALAHDGDETIQHLHDRHSGQDMAAKRDAEARVLKDELEAALGEPLGGVGDTADVETMLRAAMRQVEAQEREAEARQQARQAERQAHKARHGKTTPAARQATDAQALLRSLFRQLASALHPDRETDPLEHRRKSTLMTEANLAYARRDLGALLRLQLSVELADPLAIARMADEKAGALNQLLKEQITTLEQELATVQAHARQEFGMAPFGGVDAATLSRSLTLQRQDLRQRINQLHQDLMLVQDDSQFKRWLRAQSTLA